MAREIAAVRGRRGRSRANLGYPVVLKIDSPDIAHKTEAGGVRLGLAATTRCAPRTTRSWRAPRERARRGDKRRVVQEMVSGGVETIVGVQYDPQLGPMLVFGSGGVMVEVFGDVAMRHCPIRTRRRCDDRGSQRCEAAARFSRQTAADVDALADVLVHVSRMAVQLEGMSKSWTSIR